jgi:hypothetical protein
MWLCDSRAIGVDPVLGQPLRAAGSSPTSMVSGRTEVSQEPTRLEAARLSTTTRRRTEAIKFPAGNVLLYGRRRRPSTRMETLARHSRPSIDRSRTPGGDDIKLNARLSKVPRGEHGRAQLAPRTASPQIIDACTPPSARRLPSLNSPATLFPTPLHRLLCEDNRYRISAWTGRNKRFPGENFLLQSAVIVGAEAEYAALTPAIFRECANVPCGKHSPGHADTCRRVPHGAFPSAVARITATQIGRWVTRLRVPRGVISFAR